MQLFSFLLPPELAWNNSTFGFSTERIQILNILSQVLFLFLYTRLTSWSNHGNGCQNNSYHLLSLYFEVGIISVSQMKLRFKELSNFPRPKLYLGMELVGQAVSMTSKNIKWKINTSLVTMLLDINCYFSLLQATILSVQVTFVWVLSYLHALN